MEADGAVDGSLSSGRSLVVSPHCDSGQQFVLRPVRSKLISLVVHAGCRSARLPQPLFYAFLQPSGSAWIPDRPLMTFSCRGLSVYYYLPPLLSLASSRLVSLRWLSGVGCRLPCLVCQEYVVPIGGPGPKPCPSYDRAAWLWKVARMGRSQ